jgi:transposase
MARSLCGYYIIKTTLIDMKEDKIEENYKQLKTVERAFRELKELVRIRPIFHWEDRRVKTHIFLCILAQTIVNKIRERLKVSGWLDEKKNNSFESFLDTIDSIDLGIFEIEKAKKEIVTPPEEEQQKLLKIFNIEKSLFTNIKLIKKEFHRLQ